MSDLNMEMLLAAQRDLSPRGGVRRGGPTYGLFRGGDTKEQMEAAVAVWTKQQEDAEALVAAGLAEWRQVLNPAYALGVRSGYTLGEQYFEVLRPTKAGTRKLVRDDLYDPSAPYIIGTISAGDVQGYAHLSLNRFDEQSMGSISLYAWNDGVVTWTKERN